MTPLQEAAKAVKDELSLSRCRKCRDCPSCRGSRLRGCGCRCECPECYGTGVRHEEDHDDDFSERQPVAEDFVNPRCAACGGSGVDATNLDALTGRAVRWLHDMGQSVFRVVESPPDCSRRAPRVGIAVGSASVSMRGTRAEAWVGAPEWHDGTPEGYATALLRLAAEASRR